MTSYLRYQKELRTVQDADDIESWITVRGNHIPIKKGQSKEEAVKSFLKNKSDNSSAKNNKPESKYDPEFEVVRKNALANGNVYGGKYTQKSKAEAYKEYKKDVENKESSNKQEKNRTYYARWSAGQEPHTLKTEQIEKDLNAYRQMRISKPDNNELLDKIHDLSDELKLRKNREKTENKESSKKWSGAWSKRANKPTTLGEASKKATEISKKQAEKKWSSAWKEQAKEDLAWFSKGKTAKQRQEAGYAALEIAYNIEFGKNAAKNRSALIKEVHNSGVEDPDYIEAILNNMEEKHFESQETFRKGLKNAKKKIEPSNKNLKED